MNNYLKKHIFSAIKKRTAENKFQLCDNMQYTRQVKKKSDRTSGPVIARFGRTNTIFGRTLSVDQPLFCALEYGTPGNILTAGNSQLRHLYFIKHQGDKT